MCFFLRLAFDGVLDRGRLERALAEAVGKRSLLTATVERTGWRWVWRPDDAPPRLEEHAPGAYRARGDGGGIDLAAEPGLRASLATGAEQSELWLQVHHSCSDARGLLGFLANWFRRYESLGNGGSGNGGSGNGHPAGIDLPADREIDSGLPWWRYFSPSRKEWRRLVGFAARRPWPILTDKSDEASGRVRQFPAFVAARIPFNAGAWQALKSRLPVPASFNDVLLTVVYRTLCQWNDAAAGRPRDYWLRIAMPVDLRRATGREAAAMNHASIVFLDRRASQVRDDEHLLADVYDETRWIKENQGAHVLLDTLRSMQRFPGGIESLVAPTSCRTTTIVSNLGELRGVLPHDEAFHLGDVRLSEIDFLTPIRQGTLATLGVIFYADRLHVALQYDERHLTEGAASELLSGVETALRRELQVA